MENGYRLQKMDKDVMKAYNTRLILSHIIRSRSISKGTLAQITGLSVVSVSRITDEFIQRGLIELVDSETQGNLGRPSKDLRLNDQALRALVVYVERSETYFGIVDSNGKILDVRKTAFHPAEVPPSDLCAFLQEEITRFLNEHGHIRVIPIISLIVPGIVDNAAGAIRFSSVFRWTDVHLAEQLRLLMPQYRFVIENDIKAVATAEMYFGLSRSSYDSVVLNIGDGIGAAVIINQEIYRGQHNIAGEIGHIVTNQVGRLCECGQFGCLQTDIAEWAILQEARSVQSDITLDGVFDAYERQDDWAVKLVNRIVVGISLAINLVVMSYSPQVVILFGSLVFRYPTLRNLIIERHRSYVNGYAKDTFDLKFSTYDHLGHLVGGAILAIIESF